MELYTDPYTTHDNNTPIISVTIDSNEENTDIWNNCISSEFPIINMNMDKGQAICLIGSPHQGYTLKASQKNGKLHGEAFLYDYDNHVVASLTYQEGVANGKCTIYYRSGEIYFSGILYKGYRHGPGVEYNKNGSPIYEGFFKNGRRAPNIKLRSDGSNYWSSRGMTGNTRKSISYQITAATHFRPFSAIACLATVLSITRNARKPMAANFGKFLQC